MINRESTEFLIIDDEPLVTRLLVAYLDDKGHSCAALTDGTQTHNWLERHDCEVVVVDLNMPSIDGISLISRIREIRPRLPIVVFTGVGYDEQKMHAALRAGANGYVSKNLPIEQLYCVLSRVLTTCRQQARSDSPLPARPIVAGLA
jgi:DNA-binding response OmpR family regulator